MLESVIIVQKPKRQEAPDVKKAVLYGKNCVMLSFKT